jgi:hypothetical protein
MDADDLQEAECRMLRISAPAVYFRSSLPRSTNVAATDSPPVPPLAACGLLGIRRGLRAECRGIRLKQKPAHETLTLLPGLPPRLPARWDS